MPMTRACRWAIHRTAAGPQHPPPCEASTQACTHEPRPPPPLLIPPPPPPSAGTCRRCGPLLERAHAVAAQSRPARRLPSTPARLGGGAWGGVVQVRRGGPPQPRSAPTPPAAPSPPRRPGARPVRSSLAALRRNSASGPQHVTRPRCAAAVGPADGGCGGYRDGGGWRVGWGGLGGLLELAEGNRARAQAQARACHARTRSRAQSSSSRGGGVVAVAVAVVRTAFPAPVGLDGPGRLRSRWSRRSCAHAGAGWAVTRVMAGVCHHGVVCVMGGGACRLVRDPRGRREGESASRRAHAAPAPHAGQARLHPPCPPPAQGWDHPRVARTRAAWGGPCVWGGRGRRRRQELERAGPLQPLTSRRPRPEGREREWGG
jgi:hypothetical protein